MVRFRFPCGYAFLGILLNIALVGANALRTDKPMEFLQEHPKETISVILFLGVVFLFLFYFFCCRRKQEKQGEQADQILPVQPVTQPTLQEAQILAKEAVEKANRIREKKEKLPNYSQMRHRLHAEEMSLRQNASNYIYMAHTFENKKVDVHFMLVEDAIRLVKEKLQALDYIQPPRQLIVITGYGKTTGEAKIKPRLESYLTQQNYKFCQRGNNRGALVIQCK